MYNVPFDTLKKEACLSKLSDEVTNFHHFRRVKCIIIEYTCSCEAESTLRVMGCFIGTQLHVTLNDSISLMRSGILPVCKEHQETCWLEILDRTNILQDNICIIWRAATWLKAHPFPAKFYSKNNI